ncbi:MULTISPECIES: hypothetical protein [Actinomadura]|uniref:hypothetical protein n=1 Tax=unclassified Actinomadura TaxID=2626254 RepID=UPI0033981C3C
MADAEATPSRLVRIAAWPTSTFTFTIAAVGGTSMGRVTYGICEECGFGVLYKISFAPDWQFCGFGRLALNQLESRHPDATWFTSGQYSQAIGFYANYRQGSMSPWTPEIRPCPHFD